jgi:hypothetical protein
MQRERMHSQAISLTNEARTLRAQACLLTNACVSASFVSDFADDASVNASRASVFSRLATDHSPAFLRVNDSPSDI